MLLDGYVKNKNLILKLVAIQIPESVYVGKAILDFIENLLCDIPLVLMFKYSLKVAIIVRSRSSLHLQWD